MEQSPKSKSKRPGRDPPPVLFTTPSQNASHVSLEGALAPIQSNQSSTLYPTNSRNSLVRQRSQRLPLRTNLDGPTDTIPSLPRAGKAPSEGQKQAARTDALWAEMQSTLEEVELSAVHATHVFGPEHSRALEELRKTQIALAQAWARSEADDVVDEGRKGDVGGGTLGSEGKSALDGPGMTATSGTDGGRSTNTSGVHSGGGERMGSKLEEDTKADIVLARKRREANDRYFQRVNEGVLDVVVKLEEVASAMRSVEQESRDIWGDNETMDTASIQSSVP
ncbi:uncharacterized protein EAF01_005930 [Botrytis porri]|uniref:Uncharacterized protein n=1 Tax=Botrytis porri TaxID=87229 RepID=A0A4Z1L735_9HELO|nr:uncharacterized protein EAF01_005930 [Botrytis porri]KAF7905409.1 hypothetical protein EAF01_005930 [Botrytis porri]TGO92353.1 hypothetical protein BPOR_0005g00420 [Botrytis porri]